MTAIDSLGQEWLNHLKEWARRTIVYTIALRDDSDWLKLSVSQQQAIADPQAEAILEGFWADAEIECQNAPSAFPRMFAGLVLRWSAGKLSHPGAQ